MSRGKYKVIFERGDGGAWIARVPSVRGCHTHGRTLGQARRRIREALGLWVEDADTAELLEDVQLPPEVERALGGDVGENLAHTVAPPPVGLDALGDRVLRPRQRGDPRVLDRREDPDARVVGEQVESGHDLRVADDEPEPPAGHP